MASLSLLVLPLLPLLAAAARDGMCNPSTRILDGQPASIGFLPYQANIKVTRAKDWRTCGGALLTEYTVVTTAWCIQGFRKLTIRLGGVYRTEEEPYAWSVTTTWAVNHPYFNPETFANDIALIFLPTPAPLNASIWPAQLPHPQIGSLVGQRPIVSGWGYTGPGSGYHETLLWCRVTVIPNDICKKDKCLSGITEKQLCAGGDTTGVGPWDGGAPLVIPNGKRFILIGLYTKRADRPFERCAPTMYTRTSAYLTWIKDKAEITDT